MEAEFQQIQQQNFSEAEVLALFAKGELYKKKDRTTIPVSAEAIIDYIAPLSQYISFQFRRDLFSAMWMQIIVNKAFGLDVFALVKGKRKGELNPYRIVSIVMYMYELKIFGNTPTLRLIRALENSSPKKAKSLYANIHCKSYPLSWKQIEVLNMIINNYKTS